jgi:hypothetical protein
VQLERPVRELGEEEERCGERRGARVERATLDSKGDAVARAERQHRERHGRRQPEREPDREQQAGERPGHGVRPADELVAAAEGEPAGDRACEHDRGHGNP